MFKTEYKKVNDVFKNWVSGSGIFSLLQSYPVPWKDENISLALDVEYHGNISGDKIISPLVRKIMSGDVLTDTEKEMIVGAILTINGVNWGKQWETLSFEYNPIENYSMKEKMTNDKTINEYGKKTTRTDNLKHGKTGIETRTDNLNEETTPNLSTNLSDSIYGFNSDVDNPTGKQVQSSTGTNTIKNTGTAKTEYDLSDNNTGTQELLEGGNDSHTRNYELSRSGNIGVTTSQQMIKSERDLWVWNFFYNVVFPDIDRVLTIQIY